MPAATERTGAWRWRQAVAFVAVGGAYYLAARLGLDLAVVHPSASAVWPPSGIAVAALLLGGFRLAPAVFLGAFFANATHYGTVATSLGIALGNMLEAVCAAALVRRFAGGVRAFERPRDVLGFGLLAGVGAAAVSATVGLTSLTVGGLAAWADFGRIWVTWWLGDLGGILVLTPVIVLWARPHAPRWTRARVQEGFIYLAVLLATALAVFGNLVFSADRHPPAAFLMIPVLLWPAFRLGPRETATAVLIVASVAVAGTLRDMGPYAAASIRDGQLLLQAYLGVQAATTLAVAAAVAQRNAAARGLQRSEADLRRRAEELARSNADLERFAYAASHDLQEPLRTMGSYAQLLHRRYADSLDEDAQVFLGYVVDGVYRMREMVQGLLDLARAGQAESRASRASAEAALAEALHDLQPILRESKATVAHGLLPELPLDHTQLVQLFQNLVGNALKYRGEHVPHVRIDAESDGDGWVVSVKDNGIGIADGDARRLFRPFARLHAQGRYAGTGLGLALCRRIVEARGGRIWVESTPGRGSTFHFRLPAASPQRPAPPA